jgi:iron complex outermembrane recepter protein
MASTPATPVTPRSHGIPTHAGTVPRLVLSALAILFTTFPVAALQDSSGPPAGDAFRRAMADTLRSYPGGDTIRRTAMGDTLSPIPLEGLLVDILRSPMRTGSAPFAVSALGAEVTDRGRSDSSIEELLHGLPGVQIQNRFNDAVGERISIRGFGARSQFGVRGIRVLVDGIPATLPDGQSTLDHLDLGTVGRVEALRGPGSALYGNAAGGVLDFQTRAPPASPVRQEVRITRGDHGLARTQSTTSGSMGEVGYLLNLARYDWEGYRTRVGAPEGAVYGSARRDHVNARVTFPVAGGQGRLVLNGVELDGENPGSLNAADVALGDRRAFPGNVNQGTGKWVRQGQAGLQWEGPVGATRELEVSGYGIRRELVNPIPGTVVDVARSAFGVRTLLRSDQASSFGSVWWAVGAEMDLMRDRRLNFRNQGGEPGDVTLAQNEQVLGGAIFVQALLPVTPILNVMTGLRYDRIRFSADDRMAGFPTGDGGLRPDGSGVRTVDSASPSVGMHAALHPALGVYMNLSTAFETPTTTELANRAQGVGGFNPDLDPQVGVTSELGARGVLLPAAAWEVTFFHTLLFNELVPFEVETDPGRTYFRNSGRSARTGVEVALQVTPSPYVSGRLVVSTNDARFRSYQVDDADFSGNRVPGIIPRRAEGILRLGPGRWFLELRGETNASMPVNDANDPGSDSPGYQLVDARAGLNEARVLGLRLSPFVGLTNLLDEEYNSSVAVNAFGGRYFEPGPGRSLYLGASIAVQR